MSISPANKRPAMFLTVQFGKGPQSSGAAPRNIVVTGYRKTVGSGTATLADNTLYGPIVSEDEAAAQWGFGSEMHLGVREAFDENQDVTLWGVSYPEAVGGNYAEQTLTITNAAVLGGSLLIQVQGYLRLVEVPISPGMTANDQATAVYNEMIKIRDLPVYCPTAPVANTVLFRWNHKGARGNVMSLRYEASGVTGSTYGFAVTTVGTTDSDPSTALDALASFDAKIITCPDNSSSTTVGVPRWTQYANDRADPLIGMRGIIVAGHTGSLGQATVVSTAVNAHRCTIAWCKDAETPPYAMAARYAVFIIKGTDEDIAANIAGKLWLNFRGPVLNSSRITNAEETAALNVGLTPIKTFPTQTTVGKVSRPITTRFQTVDGNPDYACLGLQCVLVPDDIADELETDVPIHFEGYKLADNDPNEPNQDGIPNVLTPELFDDFLFERLRKRGADGQLVNVEAIIASGAIKSKLHPSNRDRLLTPNIPLQVIGHFLQWEAVFKQVTAA